MFLSSINWRKFLFICHCNDLTNTSVVEDLLDIGSVAVLYLVSATFYTMRVVFFCREMSRLNATFQKAQYVDFYLLVRYVFDIVFSTFFA